MDSFSGEETQVTRLYIQKIYLLKYSHLYYSSMPKSFTSYKSSPICTHQSTLAQALIVEVLQNITANVCKPLANKQIHDDLLQKLSLFVVETYVFFFKKLPCCIDGKTSLMKTADDSLSCVDALTAFHSIRYCL